MSGGDYRLLRTDSQDEGDLDGYKSWPESLSGVYTFLPRKWLPERSSGQYLVSSRRLSRGSDSSSSSGSSTMSLRRKNQIFVAVCILIGTVVSLTSVGLHWDKVQEFYYEEFLMPTPGNACLADPSSPASYVHWNPSTNGNRAIYHCISRHVPAPPTDSRVLPVGASLRTYRPLPAGCLDSYYTNGTGCTDRQNTTFNVVWTWVNGSDPMIARAKAKAMAELQRQSGDSDEQEEQGEDDEEESVHLFRDHDELRHSLRSVLQYFRESTKKFIILTSDFEFPVSYSPFKYLLGLEKRSYETRGATHAGFAARRRNIESEEDYEDEDEPYATARLGLLPQWLVFDLPEEQVPGQPPVPAKQTIGQWKDGDISLEVVHHAEVFDQYEGTVFNSNSIESQLANTVGDETFIYFNDDCFFAAPLSSADFHTHNFGLVFRMIAYPFDLVNPHHYPIDSPIGEWHPMEFTNYLLSERFGIRRRPYPMHQVKVLQGGLLREMWEMWPVQEAINRGHKFRGLGGLPIIPENRTMVDGVDPIEEKEPTDDDEDEAVDKNEKLKKRHQFIKRSLLTRDDDDTPAHIKTTPKEPGDEENLGDTSNMPVDDGDAHVMFLFTHFVVERSREAMLWSWIVGALGGDNDEFGTAQRDEAWRVLTQDAASEELERGKLEVFVEKRKTMEPWRVQWALDVVGDTLKASTYRFSSQDGYAYSYYEDDKGLEWWHEGSTWWPLLFDDNNFNPNVTARPEWATCTVDWNVCFDPKLKSASDVFKHITFEEPRCGDCVLKALVRASGDLGLSALLPPSDRVYRPNTSFAPSDIPPHLPLVSEWDHADFSLAGVFASGFWTREEGVNLREWVQRMLERYRYVIADTDNYFNVVQNPVSGERIFAYVDDHPGVALVTVNDVITDFPEQTDRMMREWFDQRWPTPAEWENPKLVPAMPSEEESIADQLFHRRRR